MSAASVPRLWLFKLVSAYVRHAPRHKGHWRLANAAVRWSPVLKTIRKPVVIKVHDQFRLRVDGTSQTGRIAYATGRYEPRTTAILKSLISPGSVVVDVGANVGYFSIVAARATGPGGTVLAFEPVPDVRDALIANLALNGIRHVDVRSEALSSDTGEVTFYHGPARDSGLGSLRALPNAREIRVRQVRFDDLWTGDRPVAVVKIDVEGGEMRVLRGMAGTISRDHPDIVLEVTDAYLRGLGASAAELLAFVTANGYRMFMIDDEGPLRPIRQASDLASCPSQFNALCSAKSDGDLAGIIG